MRRWASSGLLSLVLALQLSGSAAPSDSLRIEAYVVADGKWVPCPSVNGVWQLSPEQRFKICIRGAEPPFMVTFIDAMGRAGHIGPVAPSNHVTIYPDHIISVMQYYDALPLAEGPWSMLIYSATDHLIAEVLGVVHAHCGPLFDLMQENARQGRAEAIEGLFEKQLLLRQTILSEWSHSRANTRHFQAIIMLSTISQDHSIVTLLRRTVYLQKLAASKPSPAFAPLHAVVLEDMVWDSKRLFPSDLYDPPMGSYSYFLLTAAIAFYNLKLDNSAYHLLNEVVTTYPMNQRAASSPDEAAEAYITLFMLRGCLRKLGMTNALREVEQSLRSAMDRVAYFEPPALDIRDGRNFLELLELSEAVAEGRVNRTEAAQRLERTYRDLVEDATSQRNSGSLVGASAVGARLLDRVGMYDRSAAFWRTATAGVSKLGLRSAVVRQLHGEDLADALRTALRAGVLSDAAAYARELERLSMRTDGPRLALPLSAIFDLALTYYVLGETERAAVWAQRLESELNKLFEKQVPLDVLPLLASRQALRMLVHSEQKDDWDGVLALARHRAVDFSATMAVFEVLLGLGEISAERGEPIDGVNIERIAQLLEGWLRNPRDGQNAWTYRIQRSWSVAQLLVARAALQKGRKDQAEQLLAGILQRWGDEPLEPLLARSVAQLQRELAVRDTAETSVQARREYSVALLESTLRQIQWGSLGVLDSSLSKLRTAESDYLIAALAAGRPATEAYATITARHRFDYRATLADIREHRERESLLYRIGQDTPSQPTVAELSNDMPAEGQMAPFWFSAEMASADPLGAYGQLTQLMRLAEADPAVQPFQSVQQTHIRRWLEDPIFIPSGTVVVEYVRIEPSGSDPRYLGFVLKPSTIRESEPVWVDLGAAGPVDELVRQWRTAIDRGEPNSMAARALRKQLWEVLESHFPTDIQRVYIVPDGPLCQIPWCALPGNRPGTVLLEDYAVALLPYAAFCCDHGYHRVAPLSERSPKRVLLVGGVNYDDRVLLSDDIEKPATRLGTWKELPASLEEIDSLRPYLGNVAVIRLTGTQATAEKVLSELSETDWAHLATHGFFADTPKDFVQGLAALPPENVFRRQPLMRSALVFAGANLGPVRSSLGLPLDFGGLLTAETIANQPLTNLKMVVLSACQTGAGVAVGEGTVGFQRAFHLAGAVNVVASLWSVDDQTSATLMRLFYTYVFQERDAPIDALRRAQLVLLHMPQEFEALALLRGPDLTQAARLLPGPAKVATPTHRTAERYWAAYVLSGPGY